MEPMLTSASGPNRRRLEDPALDRAMDCYYGNLIEGSDGMMSRSAPAPCPGSSIVSKPRIRETSPAAEAVDGAVGIVSHAARE